MDHDGVHPTKGIPVNQPSPAGLQYPPPVNPGRGAWSSGLFGCCDEVNTCFMAWCCPCVTFGQVAEIVDKGSSSCATAGSLYAFLRMFTGCQCVYSCTYRTKLRNQYAIPGSEFGDFCTHFFCECCALSQMSRELTIRGFEVSLGWNGNEHARNQGVNMAPVTPGGMHR